MDGFNIEKSLELVYLVISDLDAEMKEMILHGDASDEITAEGHRRMIASLDKFCELAGYPCANFDKEEKV